ncbi:GspE/PulE family protein [Patescibacteria group bacterium]|nr:GspE/PulE family protein [Patescibacteria group bacterium]MBU4016026.1 GspE/PulE family protein [Patescibacteria group bacterium]MBU4098185.1 GspE/PulE family protein [Patescibacteria group bacterium]
MLITDEQLKSLLLKVKLLDEKILNATEEYAKNSNIGLGEALIEKDMVTDENLGMLIADSVKMPFIVLSKITIPDEVLRVIPEKIARKRKAIPFFRDKDGVRVAMTNPFDNLILEMISRKTGSTAFPYFATERDIYNKLWMYRRDLQDTFDALLVPSASAAPVSKIADLIINYSYQDRASDVHIEPQEKETQVRFRIDGILHDVLVLPKKLHDQIITRIKVLASLRTDEHMSPQDGKMRISLEEEELDIRVSILPIVYGEKIVMRLLASRFRQFSLVDLGMREIDIKKVTNGFKKSFGMVLSTGPTGSGKTTSIYSILKIINSRDKNITTIEDPVEYRMKGVNQIQTNQKANLTFASGLRSILRQDPNIIFVGEIRDSETAGIAVNAALTGHLVLSTLHTNDAATALPRLTDMGIEPFLVASTVNVIVAQRLLRKVCEMCKTSYDVTIEELSQNLPSDAIKKHFSGKKDVRIYKGQGCPVCRNTGYAGRIGVFEVLEVTSRLKKLITQKADADVILKQSILEDNMTTMLDDGLIKVLEGLTTIEEVLRVTKIEIS